MDVDVAVVDYDMGNLRSLAKAVEHLGRVPTLVKTASQILSAKTVILPGDGAFGQAVTNIRRMGIVEALRDAAAQKPFLGICVGFQILFSRGLEFGDHAGLGFFSGTVSRFSEPAGTASGPIRVPHMGWNQLEYTRPSRLLANVPSGSYAYFIHSYRLEPDVSRSCDLAHTQYGGPFVSVIEQDHVYATQFHPEKSQTVGLRILRNFLGLS